MNITNIDDIRKLASGDEGGRTEYKLITGQLERGMETLCAFLNGEGGTVLFGVADNGKITGQEVSDKTKREIAEAIRLFEPFATITVSHTQTFPTRTNRSLPYMLRNNAICVRSHIKAGLTSG